MNQTITTSEISTTTGGTLESTTFLNSLHQQFIILGRERNKITYKLLALHKSTKKRSTKRKVMQSMNMQGNLQVFLIPQLKKRLNLRKNSKTNHFFKKLSKPKECIRWLLSPTSQLPKTKKCSPIKLKI